MQECKSNQLVEVINEALIAGYRKNLFDSSDGDKAFTAYTLLDVPRWQRSDLTEVSICFFSVVEHLYDDYYPTKDMMILNSESLDDDDAMAAAIFAKGLFMPGELETFCDWMLHRFRVTVLSNEIKPFHWNEYMTENFSYGPIQVLPPFVRLYSREGGCPLGFDVVYKSFLVPLGGEPLFGRIGMLEDALKLPGVGAHNFAEVLGLESEPEFDEASSDYDEEEASMNEIGSDVR